MIETILFVLAFVLFAVSAYLTADLATKLTRIGFAVLTLAWILAGVSLPLHR